MAQIIKHRRGSISALKDVTANIGELVMGTGSIGDLNAQEFDSHYATVREALDSWIERFQSEADQAFEIPELEVRV